VSTDRYPSFTVVRNRLWNSSGFFFIAWAFHYFPFYLMNRQLFLHHYLPAHLCSALVAGSVFNFIMGESINYPISIPGPGMRRMPAARSDVARNAWVVVGVYLVPFIAMFVFLAPLTYGIPEYVMISQDPAKSFFGANLLLFADWMASRSTQGGCCPPGPSTLRPRRSLFRSRLFLNVSIW
jgi:hypothetical protein